MTHHSRRRRAALPWVILGVLGAIASAGYALMLANAPDEVAEQTVYFGIFFIGYAGIGAFVASRRPENAIGWLLLAISVLTGVGFFSEQYAIYGLVTAPGSLPAANIIAWPSFWAWFPGVLLALTFVPLLFPTGRLPSPRWWPLAWLAGAWMAALTLWWAFAPGRYDPPFAAIRNPFSLPWADTQLELVEGILVGPPFVLVVLATMVSVAVRFRRAGGIERQQLKWFLSAVAFFGIVTIMEGLAPDQPVVAAVAIVAFPLSLAAIPAAIGVAMLRYRLYDIDLVINRALVYGALTAVLGATYAGGVLLLSQLLGGVAQGDQLAVAVATLAMAALFRPARSRIQAAVDRRFYRSRYDARRTLDAFSSRLRDELDLDSLTDELHGVVADALRPASVSVWLR